MGRDTLAELRNAIPAFVHLPDRIEASWRRIDALEPLPVVEATIDDLAFAIVGWRSRLAHLQAAVAALVQLYSMAREAGCRGTETATAAVLKGRAGDVRLE
jgi:hypothetical protein